MFLSYRTSQLICSSYYMMGTLVVKGLNMKIFTIHKSDIIKAGKLICKVLKLGEMK